MPLTFELTDDQRMLCDAVDRFTEDQVVPAARQWDHTETLPREILGHLAELGILGLLVPSAAGGAELGLADLCLLTERLARGDAALAALMCSHNVLAGELAAHASTSRVLQRATEALASGELLGGYELAQHRSSLCALREGQGWRLTGEVQCSTPHWPSTVLLVWAHDTESDKTTAFLLTPEVMADDATLETVPLSGKLGLRALRMSRLAMKDQALGDEHRVGGVGAGLEVLENIMMRDALATAAVALGIGTCAFEAGRTYARERQQFGRAIGEFQAVQWRLADMATKLEAARFVVQHAAWSFDQGAPSFALAAKAKLAACDAALVAADGGVQIHGGYGFISDFPVERCYRDAQVCAALRTDLAASRSRVAQDLLDRA